MYTGGRGPRKSTDVLALVMGLADRVAARYKSKKKLETGTTVYQYSDRQIARRNREKAERLEKLRSSMSDLRAQVRKDLQSKDDDKRLTALAIALMDETAERVGNDESAQEGHFGVTGWRRNHISFSGGQASISYVGKSGVKHKKSVKTKAIVEALRRAYDDCKGEGTVTGTVDATKVNAYLKSYGITAKDIRGFHANDIMKAKLGEVRRGELPSDPKERKKKLQTEFKKALEETAEAVGHEPSTLRSQYLVPGLEDAFLRDGTIPSKMTREALARRSCMECPQPPTKAAMWGAEEVSWFCDTHWKPWHEARESFIHHVIDIEGGPVPSKIAFRVIERFLRG